MANLTQTELNRIYKTARRAARTRRSPHSTAVQAPAPRVSAVPTKKRTEAVKLKATRSIGLGKVVLTLGALALIGFFFVSQIDASARMVQTATVAVDPTAWDAMLDAQASADGARLERLERAGRIFTLEKGTIVRMVSVGVASRKIRVVEGEATGSSGWVQSQFLELR